LESLNHPNIVKYFENFICEKDFIMGIEYIDGKTLRILIQKQKAKNQSFKKEFICQVFYQIIWSLSYYHSLKIIHHYLTPKNIIEKNRKLSLLNLRHKFI
jgi:NIMA (never in mitosis gene a)-related kinase